MPYDDALNFHFNLYYILKEDKEKHPLCREAVDRIKRYIFGQNDGDP